jgi:hypothetical protein
MAAHTRSAADLHAVPVPPASAPSFKDIYKSDITDLRPAEPAVAISCQEPGAYYLGHLPDAAGQGQDDTERASGIE